MQLINGIYLACFVAVSSALYNPSSDVVELTANNFNNRVINDDSIWMVEFYAPWCGHCKALAPEWSKVATALKGIIKVGAVDMDVHQSVGSPYGIKGFPTIKIFGANKNSPSDYNGPRNAKGISDAAMSAAREAVSERMSGGSRSSGGGRKSGGSGGSGKEAVIELTDANFNELVMGSKDLWLVEFFAPWCGHCQRLAPEWAKAAGELEGKVKLGIVDATVHTAITSRYQVQGYPTIKVFAAGAKDSHSVEDYQGGRTAADIIQFALDKVADAVEPPELQQAIDNKVLTDNCNDKPLCVISFLPHILDSGADGRNKYFGVLKELADKYKKTRWGWIWSEAGAQPKLEVSLEVGGFGYPALVAINSRKKKFATLKGSFDRTGIDEFLRAVYVGRGSTTPLRSDSLPELSKVEPWDGKDGEIPQEEDIDLSDVDLDEPEKKEEL